MSTIRVLPRSSPGRRLAIMGRRLAVAALILLAVGAGYEQYGQWRHRLDFPRIGRLVDIGGRSLNLYCSGDGGPTVVFESGAGGPGYAWVFVQREVSKFARACWYDRAGYGWSDAGPIPRHSAAIAEDLHRLLGWSLLPGAPALTAADDHRQFMTAISAPSTKSPPYSLVPLRATGALYLNRAFGRSRNVGSGCQPPHGYPPKWEDDRFPHQLSRRHALFPAPVNRTAIQFNPHSSRSGSVQRIVSEVLRPNPFVMPPAFRAGALQIQCSWLSPMIHVNHPDRATLQRR